MIRSSGSARPSASIVRPSASIVRPSASIVRPSASKNDLALNRRLAPLAQELARLSQEISDTMLQAQSECWGAPTAFYSALARLSDIDPQLESSLKPAVEFFARRRRRDPAGGTEPEVKLLPRN